MKTINKNNVEKLVNQFTLENLTTGRAYLKNGGWSDIKIDEDFKEESINQILDVLGGWEKTKEAMRFNIRNTPISAWFASRIVYEPKRNTWTYVAGQDYPSELATIRKQLSK